MWCAMKGGIKLLYHACPPVHKIIHSLNLVDYLQVQTDNPWYNYYLTLWKSIGLKTVIYTVTVKDFPTFLKSGPRACWIWENKNWTAILNGS